jgi:hypothetical protein
VSNEEEDAFGDSGREVIALIDKDTKQELQRATRKSRRSASLLGRFPCPRQIAQLVLGVTLDYDSRKGSRKILR